MIAARPLPESDLPQVVHDDGGGATMAAEHLHQLGHRRIAQLRGPLDVANFSHRAEAFTAACARLGMTEIEIPEMAAVPTIAEGRRLTEALLGREKEPPTAIFAHNDLMAMGTLAALREAGLRVPDDVSLIGYNDLPMMDLVTPALTTIRYPSREIGLAAGELVIEILAGEEVKNVCLQPALVVRDSTRPI